jgi:hypothetical protein
MLEAELCVLPAVTKAKKPVCAWQDRQQSLPNPIELERLLRKGDGLCIVTGAVSGNLEVIDFDMGGELFPAWCDAVDAAAPGLRERLYVERTPSGGVHVIYRCEDAVEGNMKLAQRSVSCDSGDEVEIAGKRYKPAKRADTGTFHVVIALIETRGEGGICLVSPSPGYTREHGSLLDLQVLTPTEHAVLRDAAIGLNEFVPPVTPWTHAKPSKSAKHTANDGDLRPGDDFNQRSDVREVLVKHGWTLVRPGENEHWCRPGKSVGTSATLNAGCFYVHSTNATPFEPNTPYAPFGVFALLEHDGNFSKAASALRKLGFGSHTATSQGNSMPKIKAVTVRQPAMPQDADDSNRFATMDVADEPMPPDASDPGPFPQHLLHVPGLVGDVMAYNLLTAPRPQPVLALAGAIALMAVLAGRKVRDQRRNRTNLYILALAPSGSGKEHARRINKRILTECGSDLEGPEDLASDAGLVTAVDERPAILMQIDEFGRFLRTIGDASRNPHAFNIVSVLMKMYSSADHYYFGKAYVDSSRNKRIEQPCVTLYATTAPEHFRRALSPDAMADGFLARLLVFEGESDPQRQWSDDTAIPDGIISKAKAWAHMPLTLDDAGRLIPPVVYANAEARKRFDTLSDLVDAMTRGAREEQRAVWGRTEELASRLALVFACSRGPADLQIDAAAASWGCDLATYCTRRLLYMAHENLAYNEFDSHQKKALRLARERGGSLTQSQFCRAFQHLTKRDRENLLQNLLETGQLKEVAAKTGGRGATVYQVPC